MAEPARQLDSSDGLDDSPSREELKAQMKANSPSANPDAESGTSSANLQAVPTAPDRGEDEEGSGSTTSSGTSHKPSQGAEKPKLKSIKGGKGEEGAGNAAAGAAGNAATKGASSAAGNAASSIGGAAGFAAKAAIVAAGAKKNKKGLAIGGGISGLLLALLMGFMALLPLKIEAMIQNVMSKRFGFVQHSIEKRVEKIIIEYVMKNSYAADEPFVVATGSPLKDLYKTWRINHAFENQLGANGVQLEKGDKPGHVRIKLADGEDKLFTSDSQFAQFMDQDLGPRKGAELIDIIVKNETHWWNFIKRAHLRRWMKIAFGINTWKILNDNPQEDKGQTQTQEMAKLQTSEETVEATQYETELDNALADIANGDANVTSELGAGQDAGNSVSTAIKNALSKVSDLKESITNGITTFATDLLAKIIGKDLSELVLKKVVPIIGWVDLAAHIDNFIWSGKLNVIIKKLREVQYAAVFATWAIIASQIKEGDATAPAINAALTQMNGMEQSSAYCATFLGKDSNCGTSPNPDKLFSNKYITWFTDVYKVTNLPTHLAAVVYEHTLGPLYDWVSSLLGWAINLVLKPILALPPFSDLIHWIATGFMWIVMHFLGPVVTAADSGLEIMNAVDIGGDVTANTFCQSVLGCPQATTAAQYEQLQDQVAMDNREQAPGMWDRMFSTNYPGSFITRLAVILPPSPIIAVENSANSLMAIITSPFQVTNNGLKFAFDMTTPQAAAAMPADPYGIDQYGYSNAQLNQPLSQDEPAMEQAYQNAKNQGRTMDQIVPSDCPQVPQGQANICELDISTITSLKAGYTTTDDGGINSSGD
jgi:hypothetical protein